MEQIDRELQAVALEWNDLSNHRAVLVSRRLPERLTEHGKPIPREIYSHPDFSRRCQLELQNKIQVHIQDNGTCSNLTRLVLLKDAMRVVAAGMLAYASCQPLAARLTLGVAVLQL